MKWLLVIWLLSAGVGVSYSVIAERKRLITFLKAMEHSLKQVTYYMYQWRMPVEEVIKQRIKEEEVLQGFYIRLQGRLAEKCAENFGKLWQEESEKMLHAEKVPRDIKALWSDCFLHMPLEPEAMSRRLTLKGEELREKREALEEKYKGEQRLVYAMGFFAGAFLCLILW